MNFGFHPDRDNHGTEVSCEHHDDSGGYHETNVKLGFNYRESFNTYVIRLRKDLLNGLSGMASSRIFNSKPCTMRQRSSRSQWIRGSYCGQTSEMATRATCRQRHGKYPTSNIGHASEAVLGRCTLWVTTGVLASVVALVQRVVRLPHAPVAWQRSASG